jgi:oxygen-independent coproporphyrinogen-3 oxidase
MECAPGQLADATLAAVAACGINRVSFGVQSFIDREAHQSGRLHDRATVETDLLRLRTAGITNLNVDLIAGLAGQTFASWEESLEALIDSGAPHASVYMLEIDEDSRLGRELLAGGARYRAGLVPHEDAIARMYERAIDRLAEAGLMQYEISNFAQPGFESRHNLRYWQRKPYLGVGLDASSMLRASTHVLRWTTTDDLHTYLEASQTTEVDRLSLDKQHEEAWFLGLRLNAGVDIDALVREFGITRVSAALESAKLLAQDGLLTIEGNCVRLTPHGRMLSNLVFQEFLADPDDNDSSEAQVLQIPAITR